MKIRVVNNIYHHKMIILLMIILKIFLENIKDAQMINVEFGFIKRKKMKLVIIWHAKHVRIVIFAGIVDINQRIMVFINI